MKKPLITEAQGRIVLAMAIVAVISIVGYHYLGKLYIEFTISYYGISTEATVLAVENFEVDDGDRDIITYYRDIITYSFRVPTGEQFSGFTDANESETERLIGRPDDLGRYHHAIVEYYPPNPRWHRLKGWGYDGFGPPGGILSFAFRALLLLALIGLALGFASLVLKKTSI